MEIIPVIDIMGGKAVSGKSGKREEYKPLKSVFCNSSDPVEIANNLPYKRMYIADLDAIMKRKPDYNTLEKLGKIKNTMTDIGIRDKEDLKNATKLRGDIILGTETLEDIDVLKKAAEKYPKRIITSIDIKDKKVLSNFLPKEPNKAYRELKKYCRKFIILDITSVGTMQGPRYDYLEQIEKDTKIIAGGGIRKQDLPRLENIGIDTVLIGTALHNGLIK